MQPFWIKIFKWQKEIEYDLQICIDTARGKQFPYTHKLLGIGVNLVTLGFCRGPVFFVCLLRLIRNDILTGWWTRGPQESDGTLYTCFTYYPSIWVQHCRSGTDKGSGARQNWNASHVKGCKYVSAVPWVLVRNCIITSSSPFPISVSYGTVSITLLFPNVKYSYLFTYRKT